MITKPDITRAATGRLVLLTLLFVGTGLGLLAGCGTEETTEPPADTNPFAAAKVGTDATLEVVTWNLETFAKSGSSTIELAAQAIEAMDADIVACQEITYRDGSLTDFWRLNRKLDGYTGYEATSDHFMNVGFLVRTDTLLTDVTFYEILGDHDEFARTPLVLQANFAGNPFVVINNHFKCCGDGVIDADDPWDEENRRKNCNLALQQYAEANFAGMGVIMVGDFNDELSDPPAANVFENFLDDPQHWQYTDLPIALDSSALWSYPGWPSHLDHILINAELFTPFSQPQSLVEVEPLHTYLGEGWSFYDNELSDHLPVAVRLVF